MRKQSGLRIMVRLAGLVTPMLPIMLLAILAGVTGFLCAIFIPIWGGFALLSAAGQDAPFSMSFIIAAVVAMAVLRGILRYVEQLCNHYIAFRLLALIRDKVFGVMRRLAPARLEGRGSGNLIALITSDIELLEVFYAHTISPLAIAFVTSTLMTIFIFQYSPLLALVALLGYVVVGVLIPLLSSRLSKEIGMSHQSKFGEFNSFILDSLRGLGEILQYGRGRQRLDDLNRRTDALNEEQKKLKRIGGSVSGVTGTAISLFGLAMLFVSSSLYMEGRLGFEGVLIPTIAMLSSFGPVLAISNLSSNLSLTLAAGERVLSLMDEKPAVEEVENGRDVSFSGASCENVGFAYGGHKDIAVLDGVSAAFPKDNIIGIVGKSGSGKSTLMRLLMRFWDADRGTVRISGEDVRTINTSSLRAAEGFVTQETVLFNMSIEENIRIGRKDATHEEVVSAAKKAALHEFIESLPEGYRTNVGELGDRLSSGERQRIGLARAFLHDAPFLLLDEPTSNLDSLNEAILLKSLKEQSEGKTVLLISHRPSTVTIADRIYKMEDGMLR